MILLAILATLNPLNLFPDSTDIVVRNEITDASITRVHYLLAGGNLLTDTGLENPIPPGNSVTFRVSFRYMNRIILGTDTKGNYRRIAFAPSPTVDTLSISRADKEFGGLFDVVHGERPFIITSSVPVPITSIFLRNDSTLTESLIGPNPLMTDETLFLWLNRDSITIAAVDVEGNLSSDIVLVRTETNRVFSIDITAFVGDDLGNEQGMLEIVSALNGEQIIELEVYPLTGEPFFFDLSATPLKLWQRVNVPFAGTVEYIVGIDGNGRTYSIDSPDPATGAYIINWWHLDFDFDFPDRRR